MKWDDPDYRTITVTRLRDGSLCLQFADGTETELALGAIGFPTDREPVSVSLSDENRVTISFADGTVGECGWDTARAASDPEFARHLRDRDADEARRVGRRLRALREDLGLTQADVARLAGMTPPQLAKIERGESDLRLSTVRTLVRVMGRSLADIAGDDAPEVSSKDIARRAKQAGVPTDLAWRLVKLAGDARLAADVFAIGFGWPAEVVLDASRPLPIPSPIGVQFKRGINQSRGLSPLVSYAIELGEIASGLDLPMFRSVPGDPAALRAIVLERHGEISLRTLAAWSWDAGIPVIPIHQRKEFHAAVWFRTPSRPHIALKQPQDPAPFWVFDLAHELGHVALGHVTAGAFLDEQAEDEISADQSKLEDQANDYAVRLLLPNRDELARQVEGLARNDVRRLKSATRSVALMNGVPPGVLALVLARTVRVGGKPNKWWGAAYNLARDEGSGRKVIEDEFVSRVDWSTMTRAKRVLLESALSPERVPRSTVA